MKAKVFLLKSQLDLIKQVRSNADKKQGCFQVRIENNLMYLYFYNSYFNEDCIENYTDLVKLKVELFEKQEDFNGSFIITDFDYFYDTIKKIETLTIDFNLELVEGELKFSYKTTEERGDFFVKEVKNDNIEQFINEIQLNEYSYFVLDKQKIDNSYEKQICGIDKSKAWLDFFHIDKEGEDSIQIATTNGMILAVQNYNVENNFNDKYKKCCIKTKDYLELGKIIKNSEKIYFNDEHLIVKNDNMLYLTKLKEDANFPDYRKVLHVNDNFIYTLDVQSLIKNIKKVIYEKAQTTRLGMSFTQKKCVLKFTYDDKNKEIETTMKKNLKENDIKLEVNYKLFLSVIESCKKADNLELKIQSSDSPLLITFDNVTETQYLFMPFCH